MIKLSTSAIQPGMTLAKPIIDEQGHVLLRQGVQLSVDYITNLERRGFFNIFINDEDTNDVIIGEMLSDEVWRNAQLSLARVFDFVRHIANDSGRGNSEKVIAALRDSGVTTALRSHDGFEELGAVVTSILDELSDITMLSGLTQIRSHNDTIVPHSIEVTVSALMLGKRLNLSLRDLKQLGVGTLLHDIGKIILTPNASFTQNGDTPPLTEKQWREHPHLGYELLRTRNPSAVMINHVALEHHERQDGLGYPRALRGTNTIERPRSNRKNILLIAEIAAVADVYDMLSVTRPGCRALTPKQVTYTMQRLMGTFLNREVVEIFLPMIPILPAGMDIVVRSGRYAKYRGIVVQANKAQPERPMIRLLYNSQDNRIVPIDLDLTEEPKIAVEAMS